MPGLGLPNLQGVYDASAGSTPLIQLDSTTGALTIRDASTPLGGDLFIISDFTDTVEFFSVHADRIDIGAHSTIVTTPYEPVAQTSNGANAFQLWPTDRTFTSSPGSLFRYNTTSTHNYANVSFAALNLQATMIHQQAGFPFNHGLLFNHGIQYRNAVGVVANYGPLQGFIDQPSVRVDGNVTISMGLFRSFLSQPSFLRNTGTGTLNITTVGQVQLFGSYNTGVNITTWNRIDCGLFTASTGTVTNFRHILMQDVTGPSSITGLRSELSTTSKTFIDHVGTAPSNFAGEIRMNNGVALVLGTTGGNRIHLTRSSAGVLRMLGQGGTNNEGLDWNLDSAPNVALLTSSTGARLQLNLDNISFGTTSPAGTPGWFAIFSPPTKTLSTGGTDYAHRLFTSGGTTTVDAAFTSIFTDIVNDPNLVLGTGSITRAGNLLIQTSVSVGTERYGVLVTSNPTGGTTNYCARFQGAAGVRIDGILEHSGTTLGVFGTSPTTQPTVTGSRGGNAALASLLTALASLGIVVDSSTA